MTPKVYWLSLLGCAGARPTSSPPPPPAEMQVICTQVLNTQRVRDFVLYYVDRRDSLFFRYLPSPSYPAGSLRPVEHIKFGLGSSPPLTYDTRKDERKYPLLTVRLEAYAPDDSARVRVGFLIEGMVGVFTLRRKPTWHITRQRVYEI